VSRAERESSLQFLRVRSKIICGISSSSCQTGRFPRESRGWSGAWKGRPDPEQPSATSRARRARASQARRAPRLTRDGREHGARPLPHRSTPRKERRRSNRGRTVGRWRRLILRPKTFRWAPFYSRINRRRTIANGLGRSRMFGQLFLDDGNRGH
jgi:hypothetical protein